MIFHIFRKIGIDSLISAAERGETVVRSNELNHLAEIVTASIKITPRDSGVSFDFAEFTNIALRYFGNSCAVSDVIENMRKTYRVPRNDLLSLTEQTNERMLLDELLRKDGDLRIIPSL